jgi:hypothetical protein
VPPLGFCELIVLIYRGHLFRPFTMLPSASLADPPAALSLREQPCGSTMLGFEAELMLGS